MAITSSTSNDTTSGTSILTVVNSGTIENITYINSSRTLSFAVQSPFSLPLRDFIAFQSILFTFNEVISSLYNPGVSNFSTFNVAQVTDTNDGINTLNYQFYKTNHPLYNKTATYPLGNVAFGNRNQPTTLTYEEFIYLLASKEHFVQEIMRLFKL